MTKTELFLLSACCCIVAAGASAPPCHHPANFPAAKAEAIRQTLPAEIAQWTGTLAACRKKLNEPGLFPSGAVSRIGKRLEMAERILVNLEKARTAVDTDELFFVGRQLRSLAQFETYFNKETELAGETAAAPTAKILSVRDFGATGDGVSDDFQAFHATFAAAEQEGGKPVVIRVPRGTYFFGRIHRGREVETGNGKKFRAPQRSHLVMTQLRNITLEGESPENTTLLFGVEEGTGLTLVDCEKITVRNFTLRNRTTPFAEFEILATDPATKTITGKHVDGSLTPDCAWMKNKARRVSLGFTGEGGNLVGGDYFYAGEYTPETDGAWQIKLVSGSVERLSRGMRFVIPARRDAAAVFLFKGGYHTIENVTIRNSWGLGFANLTTEANNFEKCRILPADGLSLSTNADAIHSPNCTIGPALFECEFRSMGDDPFNAYNKGHYLCEADGRELVSTFSARPDGAYPIISSATGRILAECTVRETVPAEYKNQPAQKITAADAIPGHVRTYENLNRKPLAPGEEHDVYMGRNNSDRPDLLFDPLRSGAWSIISGCRFADNRNCGPVIQCDNTLLENTSIRNMESHAIKIGGFTTWREGPPPLNVLVRNCNVKNSGRIRTEFFVGGQAAAAPVRMVRNVTFLNNLIEDARTFAFSIDNASGVVLDGNRIINPRRGALEPTNADDLSFRGNTLDGKPFTPAVPANAIVWPIRFRLADAPAGAITLQGNWRRQEGVLQSSGNGFEAVFPTQYSALKQLKLSARFRFTGDRGLAGLRLIEHVGVPDNGYYFLLDGATDSFTVESRRREPNGQWIRKQLTQKTLPRAATHTITVESAGTTVSVAVDGRELWRGGAPLPVFYRSGFVSFDTPTCLESLEISAGGRTGGILAFGDSLTHHCRWQDALGKLENLKIDNSGMACDDTAGARKRLETDVVALRPRLVLVLLGTNNASAAQALDDLKHIAQRLRDEGIDIAFCTLPPRSPLPERAEKLNGPLREFCLKADLPLHDWYVALGDGTGVLKPEYGRGVHPNAAGVEAMARSFAADPAMARLLKKAAGPESKR